MTMMLFVALATASTPWDYSHFRLTRMTERQITSAEYQRCAGKSLSNEQAVQCIQGELNHLDKTLNAEYRAAVSRMANQHSRQWLRNAQRQWLKDKDEQCDEEVRDAGPTPFNMVWHQCTIDEVVRRIAWLRRLSRT